MDRYCSECEESKNRSSYSGNQWRKGAGSSRCRTCVEGYECHVCGRKFDDTNELDMHLQVHRPRSVPCPVCRSKFFKSEANAVQHLEGGYCPNCPDEQLLHEELYDWFLGHPTQWTHVIRQIPYEIPERPYLCRDCPTLSFQHASQLLQHEDQKHGRTQLFGSEFAEIGRFCSQRE